MTCALKTRGRSERPGLSPGLFPHKTRLWRQTSNYSLPLKNAPGSPVLLRTSPRSTREGDSFRCMSLKRRTGRAAGCVPLVLDAFSQRDTFGFLRLSRPDGAFPPADLEEEFLERFLSICPEKQGRVRKIAQKIRSPKTVTAFENDQTVLLNSREKLQHYELWLSLLTQLPFSFAVLVENASRAGDGFRELLFYLARNIHLKQQSLRKNDRWPSVCVSFCLMKAPVMKLPRPRSFEMPLLSRGYDCHRPRRNSMSISKRGKPHLPVRSKSSSLWNETCWRCLLRPGGPFRSLKCRRSCSFAMTPSSA